MVNRWRGDCFSAVLLLFSCIKWMNSNTKGLCHMIILSVLFLVIGLALLLGGGWFMSLGGTLYYVVAGVAFIAVALSISGAVAPSWMSPSSLRMLNVGIVNAWPSINDSSWLMFSDTLFGLLITYLLSLSETYATALISIFISMSCKDKVCVIFNLIKLNCRHFTLT